ncbi:MAG: hypothetical protein A2268_10525 [Candidatus Raymondbacteria bacterium RifOxyA12_full_50_37]|nr:MAG: hypothetical protein A2268_10525 [Candidatus Raymondbacteria bacterium RifOxyA12_full_50_37]OGJ85399.1 MAG: hypothetical protein A2248_12310 [Candidatus Raymondbacteria bacterium RIFOXYA2_FULL_49_16]OGJ94907.1 MAG: hypothetical protein A2453_07780 [Candidatus Raymondbacteria bacterium RIFOXYC2_FULL_50_21]OGK00005.1 MAG: hypothetical protein A2487_11685 [Candidatus Raymondbacteria bacterium RifOxyC12_full_50_8]OGK01237.1 MAG: hypothetical protein A2350_11480 [Candidatus Raymondbacteria b
MDIDKSIETLLSGQGIVHAPAGLRQSIEAGLRLRRQRRRLLSYALAIGAIAAALLLVLVPPTLRGGQMSDERIAAVGEYIDNLFLEVTDTVTANDTSYFLFSTSGSEEINLFDYESQSTQLISM